MGDTENRTSGDGESRDSEEFRRSFGRRKGGGVRVGSRGCCVRRVSSFHVSFPSERKQRYPGPRHLATRG